MANLPTGTVVFLFTDVEGSTQLWEQHPEAMPAAIARHDAILREAITAHGGNVFKTVGDAFCAAFPTPQSALRAAVAAQLALQRELWGDIGPLRIRLALHLGAADERDGDYFGRPLNRVARILSAGHGGQILLSEATAGLLRDSLPTGLRLRDLGEHRLKDLARPEHIYQLVIPDLPSDFPSLKTIDRRPQNLPIQPTPLIGREAVVDSVTDRLRRPEIRLVTLTGPGGIGKTRLALQIAAELSDEFEDGTFFVDLAPIVDPSLVAPAITRVLDLKEVAGQSIVEHLTEALRGRQLLLVLDNFEQVEAAAGQVAEFLLTCPRLKILVTSRAPLHLRGEHEVAVPPLAQPNPADLASPEHLVRFDAIRLFVERAQAVRGDFALTSQNAATVAEICRQVDGLPLAIELAAARVKVLPPTEILERLGSRLRLLTGGARDLPTRQQTLRNTIAWSYDLLTPAEQGLFRRLAVFAGGCTVTAAEAVCGDESIDVLDRLTALVDRNLLVQEEVGVVARFRLLATIHEFGLGLLTDPGEEVGQRARHAAYFLELVEECQRQYSCGGPGSLTWDARLVTDQPNLRAALAWYRDNDHSRGLRLATGLGWFWVYHDGIVEGEGWLTTFLKLAPEESRVRGRALLALGTLKRDRGYISEAQPFFDDSLALCRQFDDRWGIARSLAMLGHQARSAGDYSRAIAFLEESLTVAREIQVPDSVAWGIGSLSQFHFLQGNVARARAFAEESLRVVPGNPEAIHELARVALGQTESTWAVALLENFLATARRRHSKQEIAWYLSDLGRLALHRNDPARARQLLEEGLTTARELGVGFEISRLLLMLVDLDLLESSGTFDSSRLAEGFSLARRVDNRQAIGFGLLLAAQRAAASGLPDRAIRLFGSADAVIPNYQMAFSIGIDPGKNYLECLAATRTTLTEDSFEAEWAKGQALTPDEAIAYALGGN